ncbi:hypothetical protein KC799_08600 [candidate division KSB1 bacterium]|nr:hypothetical protein [candidate division KSB1 bacterium]
MKKSHNNKLILLLLPIWAFVVLACDPPFMSAEKQIVPDDHNVKKRFVLHKSGLGDPFSVKDGCTDTGCHGKDLRGEVVEMENGLLRTSSCYQCHGAIWDGD